MALTRISITLPRDLLAAADRRAQALDRPRSWVVVEALREYLGRPAGAVGGRVREPEPPAYATGLGEQRLKQLEADLALTPERRVVVAEQTARLAELVRRGGPKPSQLIQFDRYEDYLEWKRREATGL